MSRDTGVIRIKRDLKEPARGRSKRDLVGTSAVSRSKRAVSSEETLVIAACSGVSQSQCNSVTVVIAVPGAGAVTDNVITMPGICHYYSLLSFSDSSPYSFMKYGCHCFISDEKSRQIMIIVIAVAVVIVIVVIVVVIIVKIMKTCRRRAKQEPPAAQPTDMDSLGRDYNRILSAGGVPPSYPSYPPFTAPHDMTDR